MFYFYTLIRNLVTRHLTAHPLQRDLPRSLSLSFSFLLPPFPRIHDNLFYSFFYSVFSSLAIYLSVCLSITRHFTRSLTRISHTIRGIVVDHFHSLGPLTHSLTHPLSLTLIGFSIPFTMTVLPTWHRELAEADACFRWKIPMMGESNKRDKKRRGKRKKQRKETLHRRGWCFRV